MRNDRHKPCGSKAKLHIPSFPWEASPAARTLCPVPKAAPGLRAGLPGAQLTGQGGVVPPPVMLPPSQVQGGKPVAFGTR